MFYKAVFEQIHLNNFKIIKNAIENIVIIIILVKKISCEQVMPLLLIQDWPLNNFDLNYFDLIFSHIKARTHFQYDLFYKRLLPRLALSHQNGNPCQ